MLGRTNFFQKCQTNYITITSFQLAGAAFLQLPPSIPSKLHQKINSCVCDPSVVGTRPRGLCNIIENNTVWVPIASNVH